MTTTNVTPLTRDQIVDLIHTLRDKLDSTGKPRGHSDYCDGLHAGFEEVLWEIGHAESRW